MSIPKNHPSPALFIPNPLHAIISAELTVKNMRERFSQPPEGVVEKEPTERQLNPEEVREFHSEMDEFIDGLRGAIEGLKDELESADSERAEEIRAELEELEEQLEGLTDSSEAIEEAGDDAVIKVKEK